ncbi:Heat stress transcription factor A-2 [Hibiscus syriacus]|uniref:Heat stress transcription factor A-2 n=1 Tax=Hibiscus syriacus TaxID=106335 RepID=A0A6A2Z787_HIBSY|nr:heat stress transcription factor A-7a-like [Hibiscus syriacus]KAE8687557.1 Heat stress transcription factor A-2 [Hibiscus syriacus]
MVVYVQDNGGGGNESESFGLSYTEIEDNPVVVKEEPVAGDESCGEEDDQLLDLLKAVKKEEDDEETGFVEDGNKGSSPSSSLNSSDGSPKPVEGLHESGPAPFLRKTFEMVEDPDTDPIVSWSLNRNSFVVWDSYRFSEILLPKYFKHKNFSSFIRQLNTYGFRKIDSDRWEFANKEFRGGKKDLLKNIKRRSRYTNKQRQGLICTNNSTDGIGLESEVEVLKKDQCSLQMEVSELRQHQEESDHQLNIVEERIRFTERKQQQMCNFLAKMARHPDFIWQLVSERKQQKRELEGGEFSKRKRLLEARVSEDYPPLESIQADELSGFLPDCIENNNHISIDNRTDTATNEELAMNDPNIYVELEDLVTWKACSWSGFPSELVEQTGC